MPVIACHWENRILLAAFKDKTSIFHLGQTEHRLAHCDGPLCGPSRITLLIASFNFAPPSECEKPSCQWIDWTIEIFPSVRLPMPVSPSGVSGISAFHFRTCRSKDEFEFSESGPPPKATLTDRQWNSKPKKLPPRYRHAHSFWILSWNSASQPLLFLPPYCCTSSESSKHLTLWKFQSLILEPEILWKRYSPDPFVRTFFFCYAIFILIWTYKTDDLTDYQLTICSFLPAITFMWSDRHQFIDSTNPRVTSILPTASISLCALSSRFQ